ncbi:coiled-coil domain-containing protein 28A isoform X2 [Atheta coriaria]|uniref:coiled-coil domain-containing protein 28A isoform X2 n=1 Tax=Dalotia coriaria TaxID=877792 RepID=UPI0031F33C10
MESRGDRESELQQLVSSDGDNEDSIVQDDTDNTVTEIKVISPVRSNKISSSGNTSHSSASKQHRNHLNKKSTNTTNSSILFVNEKQRAAKEPTKTTATVRPRNIHKVDPPHKPVHHHSFLSEVPDVRHMERALLGLLDDFHSGKLRAFASGCTMEQMTNIREQQEKLAKLHFDLGTTSAPSLAEDNLRQSYNTMSHLIQRLEQLSVSIEGLQNSDK